MKTLYHASSWKDLANMNVGETFILKPGTQCAEGLGVYFSEGLPRVSAADSVRLHGMTAIVKIEVTDAKGWWRTKLGICKKFNRPRTWHTKSKSMECKVTKVEGNIIHCDWTWK